MIEYRISWSSFTNIRLQGATDWVSWGEDATAEEVEEFLSLEEVEGLTIALDAAGFEWWVETREQTEEK